MTTQQTPQKRRITVIPPNPQLTERDIHKKHLRVAPYCRVSTDSEEQLNSYNAQIAYYTEKIAATPEWTMVRLYADEGITGTSMKRRKEFLKMLRDCDRGKIDLIITNCHGNIFYIFSACLLPFLLHFIYFLTLFENSISMCSTPVCGWLCGQKNCLTERDCPQTQRSTV